MTPTNPPSHVRSRGIALVIVLTMLVLMSALVIAFLTMAGTERAGAQSYSSGLAARQAGESAVNLVIGQIRDATTAAGNGGTWSSQPGAIRVFDSNGKTDRVFKLYSADALREDGAAYDPTADAGDLASLKDTPTALADGWVDMNAPSMHAEPKPDGTTVTVPHYPILDPSAARPFNNKTATKTSPGIVEGFNCATIDTTDPNNAAGAKIPVLPLPVRWLYMLRDGSVGAASTATKQNPIVSRVAFWTDDDSSKVNINTASEGTYWDTPSYSSEIETGKLEQTTGKKISTDASLNFAISQPIRNEFQRYPGHPATTSLSPILRWLWDTPVKSGNPDVDYKEAIYRLIPYVSGEKTSKAGTVIPVLTKGFGGSKSTEVAPINKERLFATVDEFIFRPNRSSRDIDNPTDPDDKALKALTPDALEKVRFFLTAHSRAPELNLFSKPRVAIWPIHTDPKKRTAFDELFAFSSTVAGKGYYFTRYDPVSPTNDFSERNVGVYEYLRKLTSKDEPGWGKSFEDKYGEAERDQILTEIFDYIRTVNLVDTSTPTKSGGFSPYTPTYWPNPNNPGSGRPNDFSGQVTPILIKTADMPEETKGLGRFDTLSEAALICTFLPKKKGEAKGDMQIILALEHFLTMPGYPAPKETLSVKVETLEDVKVTPKGAGAIDAGFPPVAYNLYNVDTPHDAFGRAYMPHRGWSGPFVFYALPPSTSSTVNKKKLDKTSAATPNISKYPFFSDPIPIPDSSESFSLSGGKFRIEYHAGMDPINSPIISTVTVAFPSDPVKDLPWPVDKDPKYTTFQDRIDKFVVNSKSNYNNWINAKDVIRSVEYTGGRTNVNEQADQRLQSARSATPATHFQPRSINNAVKSRYFSNELKIHGLLVSNGNAYEGHSPPKADEQKQEGRLSKGSPIRLDDDRRSDVPEGMNGAQRADGGTGDWDRGISKTVDGAFGNHVDEGNSFFDIDNDNESYRMPYFHGTAFADLGQSYFSPNRQLSSPVMFGSLPTGVKRDEPWQTLLFRPDRPGPGDVGHPGAKSPPDYLWLDFFDMPIVEPYAISEPFSTAGKVNLNYQIAPWGYQRLSGKAWVQRDTAVRAVLKAVKLLAIPWGATDGAHQELALKQSTSYRHDIDLDKTMADIQKLFDNGKSGFIEKGGLFRSAAQICEIDLYPKDHPTFTGSNFGAFWNDHRLTGDNQRERPYSHIYPRVTTRSNVFTVHVRAQAVQIRPSALDPKTGAIIGGDLKENDVVQQGEYRGSTVIERFLDPNDPALKGYDENASGQAGSLEPYYRYRIVETKRFF